MKVSIQYSKDKVKYKIINKTIDFLSNKRYHIQYKYKFIKIEVNVLIKGAFFILFFRKKGTIMLVEYG